MCGTHAVADLDERVELRLEIFGGGIDSRIFLDFERGARKPYDRTLADIRGALEAAGVVFIDEDLDCGVGVRLSKRT